MPVLSRVCPVESGRYTNGACPREMRAMCRSTLPTPAWPAVARDTLGSLVRRPEREWGPGADLQNRRDTAVAAVAPFAVLTRFTSRPLARDIASRAARSWPRDRRWASFAIAKIRRIPHLGEGPSWGCPRCLGRDDRVWAGAAARGPVRRLGPGLSRALDRDDRVCRWAVGSKRFTIVIVRLLRARARVRRRSCGDGCINCRQDACCCDSAGL